MIIPLLYYSPSEFSQKCQKGLTSSRSGKLSEAYYALPDNYEEEVWTGSFCPTLNDTQKLAPQAYPKIASSFPGLGYSYDNSGGIIKCSGGAKGDVITYNFPSNRCFSFKMHLYTSCATSEGKMYMNRQPVGSNDWKRVTEEYLYTCSYDDCLPGYWGSSCQYGPVNYDASKNCYVSLGLSGNGRCTCSSATEIQPYCRPQTDYGFTWNTNVVEKTNYEETKIVLNMDSLDLSDQTPYMLNIIRGKLYIPASGKYQFRTEANTEASIKVDNKYTDLNESERYRCDDAPSLTTLSDVALNADNLYDIEIKYYSGCSVRDMYLKLTWKTPSSSEFVPIPSRYIFHST